MGERVCQWRVLLGLSIFLAGVSSFTAGCKTAQDCRPGTLFIRTMIGADLQSADALVVTVHRDGVADVTLPDFHRMTGVRSESIELTFPSYTANLSVTLDIVAKSQGQPLAKAHKTVVLVAGCTAADVAIGDVGADMGMTDMAAQDLSGDMAVLPGVPGPPSNVVSVAVVGGKFQLSWTAPTDSGSAPVNGYTIESNPPGLSASSTTLTYTTTALTLGTSYTFNVHATNSFGTGNAATSNAAVAGDVPSAPTNVVATAPGGRGVLNWTAASANGYPITSYTLTTVPTSQTVQVGALATSTTVTGLTTGTMYTFNLYATNAFGNGPVATSNTITANCTLNTYTLYAIDSCSVEYGTPPQSAANGQIEATRDPRLYNVDLRGWAKFSLGTVPAWAVIKSIRMTLTAGSVSIGNTPNPTLEMWYSKSDGWSRAAIPVAADIEATQVISGQYGPGAVGKQSFDVNIGARDWSADVTDRYLTLGIRNVNTNWSSNLYYGSDNSPAGSAPFLTLGTCE